MGDCPLSVPMSSATRLASTRVLPLPGPASTRSGPSADETTASCSGVKLERCGEAEEQTQRRAGSCVRRWRLPKDRASGAFSDRMRVCSAFSMQTP